MDPELKAIQDQIDELNSRAEKILEGAEGSDGDIKAAKAQIDDEIKPKLDELFAAHEKAKDEIERKALVGEVTTLRETIDKLKEGAAATFVGGVPTPAGDEGKSTYGAEGTHGWYADIKAANSGDPEARERLTKAVEGKAMTLGTPSGGGFLVADQISSELLELRQQATVVPNLVSSLAVENSDTLRIGTVTGGLTAGWVAELAAKPQADLAFGEITSSIFTAAGLAVASNQLIRTSPRSIDGLVNADLAKRLATVLEVAILNGSGTGQPLGILNTPGVNSITYTDATPTPQELLDQVFDAITAVYTNFLAPPNAIVLHPRTWAYIAKARESTSPSTYLIGPGQNAFGRRADEPIPGYGAGQVPRGELFGLPVYTTANVPTNLGAGTNESRIIVGDFSQALLLTRGGFRTDQSEHVYFTTNQTVFRAEEDHGFTAARYPKAFSVIGGTGLAGI